MSKQPSNVAGGYLAQLAQRGIDTLFVNAGTDFAPLAEAYATATEAGGPPLPRPVVCAHENLAAGMAHGAYLASGRPQAVMFHVSVGTANAVCALVNAARDNVPMLVTAGRTPVLEQGAVGARDTHIHWAQELFDQAGMVRELVKWDYELRDARQVGTVADRALTLAMSHPRGPVYLSLPRELLAAPLPEAWAPGTPTALPAPPEPSPAAVAALADRIATAELPVVLCAASGAERGSVAQLGELCQRHAVGVVEVGPRYVNVAPGHRYHLGTNAQRVLAAADVVLVLECDVPWMQARLEPRPDAFVAQCGVDPLYARYPVRSHRSDLTIAAAPTSLLRALAAALHDRRDIVAPGRAERLVALGQQARDETSRMVARERAASGPITKAYLSMALADQLGPADVVCNEYWALPELLARSEPGTFFSLPPSGGLGWALPVALGAKYADPSRTVVATIGDGAYLFANPAACHHVAAKYGLAVLAVVANNSSWGAVEHATRAVYPEGRAVASGYRELSDLSPAPAYEAYCQASGGFGVRVADRSQLPGALERALHAVRQEGRQALLNIECA